MTTKSLILFEVLNVLFSSIGGHGDILEFGLSGGARVRVSESGLELMDKVEEGGKGGRGDVGGIGDLCVSHELVVSIFGCFASLDRLDRLISPFCCISFTEE